MKDFLTVCIRWVTWREEQLPNHFCSVPLKRYLKIKVANQHLTKAIPQIPADLFDTRRRKISHLTLTKAFIGSTINNTTGGTTNAKCTKNYTHFRS